MVDQRREDADQPSEGPRSFTRMLEALNDGVLVHELSLEQFKLLKRMFSDAQAAGAGATIKGELTLTLKYEVGNDQTVDIIPDIKLKEPKKRRNNTTAWVTAAGNVSFSFPRQETLPSVSLVGQAARPQPQPQQARTIGGGPAVAGNPPNPPTSDSEESDGE